MDFSGPLERFREVGSCQGGQGGGGWGAASLFSREREWKRSFQCACPAWRMCALQVRERGPLAALSSRGAGAVPRGDEGTHGSWGAGWSLSGRCG